MEEPLYTLKELEDLANRLLEYSDCRTFCGYIINREIRSTDVHTESIGRLRVKCKNEQELKEKLRETLLAAANIDCGAYKGWKYSPIDRVTRFLYEIPFDEIHLHINHASDPSKKAILRWRLSIAGK